MQRQKTKNWRYKKEETSGYRFETEKWLKNAFALKYLHMDMNTTFKKKDIMEEKYVQNRRKQRRM